jgi:hypothetical protein
VDTIVVDPLRDGAYAGSAIPLSATLWLKGQRTAAADAPIHWSSNRVDRAWVAEDGMLVLLTPGRVTLTARYAMLETRTTIEVRAHPAEGISLVSDAGTLVRTGDTVRCVATVYGPSRQPVMDARVQYGISARGIPHAAGATIDAEGRLVAQRPGLYTVIATAGSVADKTTILVSPRQTSYAAAPSPAVRRIEVEDVDYEPLVGTVFALTATVWTRDGQRRGADVGVTWTSSDPEIALVDEHGVVAFRKSGRVTISAQAGTERATRKFDVRRDGAAHLALTINTSDIRVGDAVRLREEVWQMGGAPIRNAHVNYAIVAHGNPAAATTATVSDDRVFTAREPGVYTIVAELGGLAEHTTIVVRPRN